MGATPIPEKIAPLGASGKPTDYNQSIGGRKSARSKPTSEAEFALRQSRREVGRRIPGHEQIVEFQADVAVGEIFAHRIGASGQGTSTCLLLVSARGITTCIGANSFTSCSL
jgi:hypothetical protein